MKPTILATTSLVLLGSFAVARNQTPEVPRSTTQVLNDWARISNNSWFPRPTPRRRRSIPLHPARVNSAGEFKGARTFAEQAKHLAAANYQLGSRIFGEPPPPGTQGETAPESVKSKAQIMEYLKGSFVCLYRAAAKWNCAAGEPLTTAKRNKNLICGTKRRERRNGCLT